MIFTETPLKGAYLIEPELIEDERGFFARTFCAEEFESHALKVRVAQRSLSYNHSAGTVRGLHFQESPACEVKLVRCLRGAIFDVIIDLRQGSASYLRHFAVELTGANRRSLYIPESFAHGFQTLVDHTEIEYQMSEFHAPQFARGYRYDDSAFAIDWPRAVNLISRKDLDWPRFS